MKNMDPDFEKQIKKLAIWVLGSELLVPKVIDKLEHTGNSFIPFVKKWAELVSKEEMTTAKNINAANAESTLFTQLFRTQKAFDEKFKILLAKSTTTDVFKAACQNISNEIIKSYESSCTKLLQEKYDKKGVFIGQLKGYMETQFKNGLEFLNVNLRQQTEAADFHQQKSEIDIRAIEDAIKLLQQQHEYNEENETKIRQLEKDLKEKKKRYGELINTFQKREQQMLDEKRNIEQALNNERRKQKQSGWCSIL